MVNVYTSYAKVKRDYPGLTLVDDNDVFFDEEENGETGIDDVDFGLMKTIDNITFCQDLKSTQNTKSPFGPVKMFDLSTGCKTAINLHHSIRDKKQVVISITECGENAVYECFKLADNTDTVLLLQHGYISSIPNSFEFLINGEFKTTDIDKLSDYAAEGV